MSNITILQLPPAPRKKSRCYQATNPLDMQALEFHMVMDGTMDKGSEAVNCGFRIYASHTLGALAVSVGSLDRRASPRTFE